MKKDNIIIKFQEDILKNGYTVDKTEGTIGIDLNEGCGFVTIPCFFWT